MSVRRVGAGSGGSTLHPETRAGLPQPKGVGVSREGRRAPLNPAEMELELAPRLEFDLAPPDAVQKKK